MVAQEAIEISPEHIETYETQPEDSNRLTAIVATISVSIGVLIVESQYWDQDLGKIRFMLESLGIGR